MIRFSVILLLLLPFVSNGQYAPAANVVGTTAIHKDSAAIVNWAQSVFYFQRGFEDIAAGDTYASFGDSTEAIGYAQGNSTDVVSLGDAGEIVLAFEYPIQNGPGPDFAVFENGFGHDYLELAHVEVSSNGIDFVRFPSKSATQNSTQIGTFGTSSAEFTNNLAGKYIQGYGTPFDLEELTDSLSLNLDSILYVKIIDVVGSINPAYGSYDSQGEIINDPYPTAFEPGGFDLDGVAVIHENNIYANVNEEATNFLMFPNPAKEVFRIQGYEGEVSIFDLNGRLVKSIIVLKGDAIDVTELQASIYLVKIGEQFSKLQVYR